MSHPDARISCSLKDSVIQIVVVQRSVEARPIVRKDHVSMQEYYEVAQGSICANL